MREREMCLRENADRGETGGKRVYDDRKKERNVRDERQAGKTERVSERDKSFVDGW